MSIRKRLILSNIAMILVPVLSLIVIEGIVSLLFYLAYQGNMENINARLFMQIRFWAFVLVVIVTNSLLASYVSKNLIVPIHQLSIAAKQISQGNFTHSIKTERKDELGKFAQIFEEMRFKLIEAEEQKVRYEVNRQELIAHISHDLKTPLTLIKGYVKGVQEGVANTPEKLEHYLQTIDQTATEMNDLIDELLLYSKLELEEEMLQMDQVNLHAFFEDLIDELAFFLEKEGGVATLQVPNNESYLVLADQEKLRRIVQNLIQNSLKYMDKEEKQLQVCLSVQDNQEVVVEMKDNGSGISQTDLPFIFDSFYRTDASRNSETGGSGLGLSIVKKIVSAHGGKIWAKSIVGEGTSIYFTLKKVT